MTDFGSRRVLSRVVSGGQTGVDRAALDAAEMAGLCRGGWCPAGRRAEDGPIPDHYPLTETLSTSYEARTEANVRDSDGTLILYENEISGGTALTLHLARIYGRPVLLINLEKEAAVEAVVEWLGVEEVGRLNVAGPRESQRPGIYSRSLAFLRTLFDRVAAG